MEEHTDVEMAEVKPEVRHDNFKKPQMCLVGPRKSKGSKVRVVESSTEAKPKEEKSDIDPPTVITQISESAAASTDAGSKASEPQPHSEHRAKPRQGAPAQKLKETPIPYLEPKWGGTPTVPYNLDVIKSGLVLDPIDLSDRPFHVFGRLTNCDVVMAHPTVSRHHAVLQYSRGTDEKPEGFYLYDLGSTHGTFLNKNRVKPEMFIRLKVGHQIKLGGSTRLYLLQGPSEDMEDESELTVTELKAKRQQELQARELAELTRKQKEEEEEKKREEEGVDWGMGDDADEETDLSENPYATTTNEDLYIDDPKKTLRGWFEREGHELEYDVEEKGPGQFLCRVEVPVEGARGGCMVAEALVKGKKKEAVAQCALEACRLLDRLGLLRQATHESRKRKAKNWEEEDFYDSDDDNFLDRTGAIERKRQQRMKQAGKGQDQVETYQSLCEKHSNVVKALKETQAQLQKAQADLAASRRKDTGDEEGDSLESFMSNLSNVGCVDKQVISKLKSELVTLNKEEAQLRKLVNIARPTSLPELVAPITSPETSATKDTNALKNKLMLAARKKASLKQKVPTSSSRVDCAGSQMDEEEEEREIVEEHYTRKEDNQRHKKEGLEESVEGNLASTKPVTSEENVIIGPAKPAFLKQEKESSELADTAVVFDKQEESLKIKDKDGNEDIDDSDEEVSSKDAEKRRRKNRRRQQLRNEKALERTKAQYDSTDPNYSVWVPPEDQTGDGTTSLNARLGY